MLALMLLLIGTAGLIQLYNGGQLVAEKSRLVHATDAAAYSGALIQARALNFQAYANRAQLAHQVAMAHLVTLASWTDFGATQAQQAMRGNPPSYLIGMLFGSAHGSAYQAAANASAQETRRQLHQAFQKHDALVNDVLWQAQLEIVRTLPRARNHAMQTLLATNHLPAPPANTPLAGEQADALQEHIDHVPVQLDPVFLTDELPGALLPRAGSARETMRQLVLQATYPYDFLHPRNYTARNTWMVSHRCPHLRHQLRRRGGTMLEGYDVWRSHDSQSYHALRSNRWIGCYYREYPLGWAENTLGGNPQDSQLEHVENAPNDFSQQDFWRWAQQNTTWDIFRGRDNPLANSRAVADSTAWRGKGMPGYIDLRDALHDEGLHPVRFTIRAIRGRNSMPTTDQASKVRIGRGFFQMPTDLYGDVLAAVSAAETYFERPTPRNDGLDELASLFHPYWQARLSPVTSDERSEARRRQML